MGEILSRCCDISLAFAMITFPALVAIPVGISVYFRNPRQRFVWIYDMPIIIAACILAGTAIVVDIDLITRGGPLSVILAILLSITAIIIMVFLLLMSRYVYELSLQAEYERATRERTSRVV